MGNILSALFLTSFDKFAALFIVGLSVVGYYHPEKIQSIVEFVLYHISKKEEETSSMRLLESNTTNLHPPLSSFEIVKNEEFDSLPEHLQLALGIVVSHDLYQEQQHQQLSSNNTNINNNISTNTATTTTIPQQQQHSTSSSSNSNSNNNNNSSSNKLAQPPQQQRKLSTTTSKQQQGTAPSVVTTTTNQKTTNNNNNTDTGNVVDYKNEREEQEQDLSFARRILGAFDLVSVNERIKEFENASAQQLPRVSSMKQLKASQQQRRVMVKYKEPSSPSSSGDNNTSSVSTATTTIDHQDQQQLMNKPNKPKPQIPKKQLSLCLKRFIQKEEEYLSHLGYILPSFYKNQIMEIVQKRNIDGEAQIIEKLFSMLINSFSADRKHLRLMQLKRHLAEQTVSEANDQWLDDFGDIILEFVQDTLITKYIDQYLVEYTKKGLRYRIQKILLDSDKQLKTLIEDKLDIDASRQSRESKLITSEFLTFEQIIQQPTTRLTYYLVQFRDVFHPLIPDDHPCLKLETAIYKLEKKMITHSDLLEMAYQLNKTLEIQNRLNIENLERYTAFDLEYNLSPSMSISTNKRESTVYKIERPRRKSILEEAVPRMPKFIYSVQSNATISTCNEDGNNYNNPMWSNNYYDSNEKLIYKVKKNGQQMYPPCEAFLFENVLIISWLNSKEHNFKREKKLYYIDTSCIVEKYGERGFKLVYAPEKQKLFQCETPEERRRWIHYIRSILSGSLLSAQETKQIVKHLRSVSSLERPEARYAEDLDALMARRANDHAKFDELEVAGENVAFAEDGSLIGATIEKLVERMTVSTNVQDMAIKDAFLLTYHSFTTAEKFLELLSLKWNLPPPSNEVRSNSALFSQFEMSALAPIRINIYGILKRWITDHSHDFKSNPGLTRLLSNFIENHMAKTFEKLADNLRIELKRIKTKRDTLASVHKQYLEKQIKEYENEDNGDDKLNAPKPIYPSSFKTSFKNLVEVKVLDWSSVEIARQLTLLQSAIFQKIQPKECLGQAWNKNKSSAPNICEMINRTNTVVLWVAHQILDNKKEEKRVKAIRKFIKIARELRKLNNFNGLKEVIGGLRSVPIVRLKKTWSQVPKKHLEEYKELEKVVSTARNYKEMRTIMKECTPPLIPFIGLYLTDLTFIEDGNKDYINEEKKIINFFKRQKLAFVIQGGIKRYQKEYDLKNVTELKSKLINMVHFSEDKLIELSLSYEPNSSSSSSNSNNTSFQ